MSYHDGWINGFIMGLMIGLYVIPWLLEVT